MKIAILAPAWFAVPPVGYGGIEWIVWLLADGLAEAGYDVTLFASGDSRTKAKLAAVFPEAPSKQIGRTFWELKHALSCFARADEFDVINDHTGMLGMTLGATTSTPVVHTVHGPLNGEPGEIYDLISRVAPQVGLISISMNQREPKPDLNWIANCPNALDFSVYPVKPHRGEYLLFLGRMSPDKGAHRAVAVAMEAGLPLKLAGKMQEPKEREYFHELVEPHLVDGIEYLGEVTHGEKVELLQNARATLFPIEWEEPFGLVMIESMACGTPVIATRWGAVPEVIEDGRSGIIVDHYSRWPTRCRQRTTSTRSSCAATSRKSSRRSEWCATTSPPSRRRSANSADPPCGVQARGPSLRRGEASPALTGEEAELAEEVHLVEEQVLGLQRVAVGDVNRRPPELNGSSCRRDIAVGGVEHTIMGARDGPFGRCGWPVGEELLDLKAEVRERFLEHAEEADDVVATADLGAWRRHLRIGGPRIGVAVMVVDGVDVLEDHVSGVGHLLSDRRWERESLRSRTFASDEKQKRGSQAHS